MSVANVTKTENVIAKSFAIGIEERMLCGNLAVLIDHDLACSWL
jgi:hypothetical protein